MNSVTLSVSELLYELNSIHKEGTKYVEMFVMDPYMNGDQLIPTRLELHPAVNADLTDFGEIRVVYGIERTAQDADSSAE